MGSIIQLPSLDKGDRLIVEAATDRVPDVIAVTYAAEEDDMSTSTIRYVALEYLPDDVRAIVEEYLQSIQA
jgi:hypothetical protein